MGSKFMGKVIARLGKLEQERHAIAFAQRDAIARPQAVAVAHRQRHVVHVGSIGTAHIFQVIGIALHPDISVNPRHNF